MPAAWKTIAALVVLTAVAVRSPAADPPPVVLPLTAFDVLGLVQQGLDDDAIIRKLRETRSTFRLSPDDAARLRVLGVSPRVLAAMTADPPTELAPPPRAMAPDAAAPGTATLPGTWVRELDGMQVVLKFTSHRLFATLNLAHFEEGKPDEVRMTFRADADYAVGPDGTVFGVVTGTDLTPPNGGEADMADLQRKLTELNGMPFCFRFRIDIENGGVLSIRDLRCGLPEGGPDTAAVLGRYTLADGEPAPPKPARMRRTPALLGPPGAGPGTVVGATTGGAPGAAAHADGRQEKQVYYMTGPFGAAQYPLPRGHGLDVIQAIAEVGPPIGPTTGLTVLRRLPGGRQIPIEVDLAGALRDPQERLSIQPGDILVLRERPTTVPARLRERAPAPRMVQPFGPPAERLRGGIID
jgi:hypothetical protein